MGGENVALIDQQRLAGWAGLGWSALVFGHVDSCFMSVDGSTGVWESGSGSV